MKTENKIILGIGLGIGLILWTTKNTNMGKNTGGTNNPGNIRNSGGTPFLGETTKPGDTFKSFKDINHGIRAMIVLIKVYGTKYGLNTVKGVITRWAPPSDNNPTDAYIKYVSDGIGIKPTQVFNATHLPGIVRQMSKMEGRRPVTISEAHIAYNKFFG